MAEATAVVGESGPTYQRAITAGVIGNVLEWYDYGVYGYLVPIISALFFPSGDRRCRCCRPSRCSGSGS